MRKDEAFHGKRARAYGPALGQEEQADNVPLEIAEDTNLIEDKSQHHKDRTCANENLYPMGDPSKWRVRPNQVLWLSVWPVG